MARDITEADFETAVLERSREVPVVIDFWAPWCGPCRMVAPVVEEIAKERSEALKVVKLNVDDNPSVTQRFGIKGIPTLIVFKGGKEAERLVGATNEQSVALMIEAQLSVAAA